MWNFFVFLCCSCLISAVTASGKVILIRDSIMMSFGAMESDFAPTVKGSGIHGTLYVAEPLDACSPLTHEIDKGTDNAQSSFALIIRGGCSFDVKVRRAQAAGFKAAIVYDNRYGDLIAMHGDPPGVRINAVFVSKSAGETLRRYSGVTGLKVWIYPRPDNLAWNIVVISFLSLLVVSAVLASYFFVQRNWIRRATLVCEFSGMSSRLVKAMPSLIFTAVLEDNCTSSTCAICLDDYKMGDKLRVLPCRHKFHDMCVDAWLTSWRTFCPICKRDAKTSYGKPLALESTPLLQSNSSSSIISSFRSSVSSPVMQISFSSRSPHQPIHASPHSIRSSLQHHQSMPPYLSPSRSSTLLRNMASPQVSQSPHVVSPYSLGYPSVSPLSSRYMPPYVPSPSNTSSSFLGSPSASAHSLPDF